VTVGPADKTVLTETRLLASFAGSLHVRFPIEVATAATCVTEPPTFTLRACSTNPETPCAKAISVAASDYKTTFSGLQPGLYEVEMLAPPFAPLRWRGEVAAGMHEIEIGPEEYTIVRGHIVRGETPVAATVEFATGGGVTDSSGNYTAILSGPPGRDPVRIQFCGSTQEYHDVPAHEVGAIYDIAVPDTRVDVTVRSVEGRPIASAAVTATIFTDATSQEVSHNVGAPPTDEEGASAILTLPPGERLRVCASHPDFTQRCSEALVLKDATAHAEVLLTLSSARARAVGRVITHDPIEAGMLWWVSPAGVTEQISVSADGRFQAMQQHAPDEYVVFSSATHPLVAGRPVSNPASGELEFVPSGILSSVSVEIKSAVGRPTHFLGLIVDGLTIPSAALDQHASFRGVAPMILGGAPVTIPGVLVRSGAAVVLGPTPQELNGVRTDWMFDLSRIGIYRSQSAAPPAVRVSF
jgi:hypothetical protein